MPTTTRRYTVEEVLAFPADGNRYELVHGELLVTPAPTQKHQIVLKEIFFRLRQYLRPCATVARAFFSPADIIWSAEEYVQPDIFVVPAAEVTGDWRDCQTLWLAVEVLSPSSARHDRVTKRNLHQEKGVATYWVIDADARIVEVWRPDDQRPEIVSDLLRWRVTAEALDLEIRLEEIFRTLP
ncbi:MAG: Uma2 family endonuclease [Gemmatimonadetes bacterium]|nr:Uma2 family endonuclease [Gemmatimonadota bacterium]